VVVQWEVDVKKKWQSVRERGKGQGERGGGQDGGVKRAGFLPSERRVEKKPGRL